MRVIQNNSNIFFEGVVEGRDDPLRLGRVRVRVFGIHTENLPDLPSEELLWASVLMPVTSASTTGVGATPALVEGSHVVGYFRDGIFKQDPVIIGSILGVPVAPRVLDNKGFRDLRRDFGNTPSEGPYPRWVEEPDTSRLARNEKATEGTALSKRIASRATFDGPLENTVEQPDPAAAYKTVYPYNKVITTEAGHTIELDDTRGAERISITHKSGTFIEMYPDGTIVCRTIGNSFNLVDGTTNEYSKGTYNLTIDATGNVYCKGNYTFKTDGNMTFDVKGDVEWNIKGNVRETVTGNIETQSQHINVKSKTDINMIGDSNINITGSSATTIKGGGTTEELNSNYSLSTGSFGVTASSADFTL